MTIKDSTSQRASRARTVSVALLLGASLISLTAFDGPAGSDNGISVDPRGADRGRIELVHTPLIPRKTRHIIKFNRWGIA